MTRRSLHLWANGGPINTPNEKRVRDLLVTMRKLDRGTARENRSLLIAPQPGGGAFSDLLRSKKFEEALALAGQGPGPSGARARPGRFYGNVCEQKANGSKAIGC